MKKYFVLISIAFLVPLLLHAETTLPKVVYHITQDMNTFSTFFPLKEGSQHEEQAVKFIKNRLASLDVTYSQYPKNTIDAVFPGTTQNEIFFIVPLDTWGTASKYTYAFNLASALMLAQTLKTAKLQNRVHIVFMGAEFGTDQSYPLGTAGYLGSYYPEHNSAFFYCAISGIPEKIDVSTAATGTISPLWLLKRSIHALQRAQLPYGFRQGRNLIYRLRLNDHPSILDRYMANDYPAILFTTKTTAAAVNDRYYSFLLHLAAGTPWNIPSNLNWDRHYLFLNPGGYPLFVNEQTYILFLILLFSLILLYPFIEGARFNRYAQSIVRHLWTVPVLFLITFLFLSAATFALKSIFVIRSFDTLWRETPLLFLLFKLLSTSFLFLLSVRLFTFLKFAYKGSFYSAASMLFIILDVLVLSAVDISFAFYLVPVLFSIFLFTIFRNRWKKLFFLVLSTAILLAGMVNMFYSNSYRVIHIFLLSAVYGNLIITANLLPVLLMTYRIRFLFHSKNAALAKKRVLILDVSLGVLSLALYGYLSLFNPFSESHPQPLTLREDISLDTRSRFITLESPAPLGTFTLEESSHSTGYTTNKRMMILSTPFPAKAPSIVLTRTGFLNRVKYALSYYGESKAERIEAKLISDSRIVLFDSNFPYGENNDATEITFNTGFFPPLNFYLSFTLPRHFNGELLITGVYENPEDGIGVKNHLFSVKHVQYFKKKVLITNAD